MELVKSSKLSIFKLFTDVDNHIKSLSDTELDESASRDEELYRQRDQQITSLVNKITSNGSEFQGYYQSHDENRQEIDDAIDALLEQGSGIVISPPKLNLSAADDIKKMLKKMGGQVEAATEKPVVPRNSPSVPAAPLKVQVP